MRRSAGFVRLLAAQTVSNVGSQVTGLALPLIAVLALQATPAEMGLLGALDNLPYLLVGLWVGVVVDRVPRRRLMVAVDLARAVVVASIPIAALTGRVTFWHLCVVAFAVGVGNIAFDVASQAHLPELVAEPRLVDANGALQTSASLAAVGAPGAVGLLVQLVGAPLAMVLDAVSYVVSAACIGGIRQPERPRPAPDASTWQQVRDGWRLLGGDRRLVGLAGGSAMVSLGMNALTSVLLYHLADRWGFGPLLAGLVMLAFGAGGAVGALSASALAVRVGAGRVLTVGPLLGGLGLGAVVAADALPRGWAMAALYGGAGLTGAGLLGYLVLAAGVRQAIVPDHVRGRVLGTMRFVEWGAMPVGAVLGGVVGEWVGAPSALALAAALVAAATVWTVASPLRTLRDEESLNTQPDS